MEDAATAEIRRSQLWQWIRDWIVTAEGTPVDRELVRRDPGRGAHPAERRRAHGGIDDRFDDAAELLAEVSLGEEFPTFLTIPAYTRFLVDEAESTEETGEIEEIEELAPAV